MEKFTIFPTILVTGILISQVSVALGQQNSQARPARSQTQSPASLPRPKSATPQKYTAEQVRQGEVRFGAQCGFCHGKDAAGGESGPDLTRAELVAKDTHGDRVGPVIRAGRPSAGMPSFNNLSEDDLNAIIA